MISVAPELPGVDFGILGAPHPNLKSTPSLFEGRVSEPVRSSSVKIKSEEETFPCLSQTGESASSFLTHAPCRGLPSLKDALCESDLSTRT